MSVAKCETGWGDGLSTRTPFETRDCHPTPPLLSFASTLPLQGRVTFHRRRMKIPIRGYLAAVLPGIADVSIHRLADLTPAAWAARQQEHAAVRTPQPTARPLPIPPAPHYAHLFFIHSPISSPNSFLEQMVSSDAYLQPPAGRTPVSRRRPRRRCRRWYRRQCGSLCSRALLGTPPAHFPYGGNDVRLGQPSFLRLGPPVRVHAVPPLRAFVLPKRFTNQFTHCAVLFPRYLFRTSKHFRGKSDRERFRRTHRFIVAQCLARLRMIRFREEANRTSVGAYRGSGLKEGLRIRAGLKAEGPKAEGFPILTDIHEAWQAEAAAEVADILQIPAFLCRQTDLLIAAGRTGRIVNIKKGQFVAPHDIHRAAEKVASTGNSRVVLTERGSSFGYNNLVVDMRGLKTMRDGGWPVVFEIGRA